MGSIKPTYRGGKATLINEYQRKCIRNPDMDFIMIGDSIVSNFTKHCSYIWNNGYLIKSMNLGIPGDKVEQSSWKSPYFNIVLVI